MQLDSLEYQVADMLTVEEVAAMLRISRMTVYRMVNNDEISHIRIGRSFRIPRVAFEEYIRVNSRRAMLK